METLRQVWLWVGLALFLGGIVVAYVGMFWLKLARIMRALGDDPNEDRGFWVMVAGCLAGALGLVIVGAT